MKVIKHQKQDNVDKNDITLGTDSVNKCNTTLGTSYVDKNEKKTKKNNKKIPEN